MDPTTEMCMIMCVWMSVVCIKSHFHFHADSAQNTSAILMRLQIKRKNTQKIWPLGFIISLL